MDRIVNHIFAFEGNGVIKDFPGGYSDYRLWRAERERVEQQELILVNQGITGGWQHSQIQTLKYGMFAHILLFLLIDAMLLWRQRYVLDRKNLFLLLKKEYNPTFRIFL